MDDTDIGVPTTLEALLQNSTLIAISLIVVVIIFPWFLLALAPMLLFYKWIVAFTRPSQRELKRLDAVSRSPLFSHISASLQGYFFHRYSLFLQGSLPGIFFKFFFFFLGLPTIHAYDKKGVFIDHFYRLIDTNLRAFFAFYYVGRWFGMRLDVITTMLTGATSFIVVGLTLHGNVSPGLATLAWLYANSLAGMFQFTTRLMVETEGWLRAK